MSTVSGLRCFTFALDLAIWAQSPLTLLLAVSASLFKPKAPLRKPHASRRAGARVAGALSSKRAKRYRKTTSSLKNLCGSRLRLVNQALYMRRELARLTKVPVLFIPNMEMKETLAAFTLPSSAISVLTAGDVAQ